MPRKVVKLAAPVKMDWTPERVAELQRRVAAKENSAQIAEAWGCTRNAVCGKMAKLGLRFESNFWRPDKIARFEELAAAGWYADEIASDIGTTRGAVYDKSYRLGIKVAVKQSGPKPTRQAKAFQHGAGCPASGASIPPQDIRTTGPTKDSLNLRMWDPAFKANCCAWSTGEDAGGYFFCAAPKLPGFPYCRPHAQAAYRPAPPRPPSAVKDGAKRERRERDDEPQPLDFGKAA